MRGDIRLRVRRAVLGVLCALALLPLFRAGAAGAGAEYAVKAAYVYNFIQLIGWPSRKSGPEAGPIRICVLGSSQLGEALSELRSRQVGARGIIVSSAAEAGGSLADYHVVVIGPAMQEKLPEILKVLEGTDVLTVGDIQKFSRRGGMIGFFNENGRVRIELNISAARQAGLKVSAKLMEVAKVVR